MKHRFFVSLFVAGLMVGPLAEASTLTGSFDEVLTATAPREVWVENVCGEVTVTGGPGASVRLQGRVGSDGEVEVREVGRSLRIEVERIGARNRYNSNSCADLALTLPKSTRVEVSAVSADVTTTGVTDTVELTTVSGEIRLGARPTMVALKSVSGDIRVEGVTREAEIQTVSGNVDAEKLTGRLEVESVSGDLSVTGTFDRMKLTTVSGEIEFLGAVTPGGRFDLQAHSGDIGLVMPPSTDARFDVQTFSGGIRTDGQAKPSRGLGPGSSLSFTQGQGAAQVSLNSFSGNVSLQTK